MRPFALGCTAFLLGHNTIYLLTNGAYASPDSWSDIYMVFLAAYAGAPELKRWMRDTEPENPDAWPEKIRKGGPIITLWVLLLFAAGLWRIADPTHVMPPELKETTIKVIGVFFGAYALRQYRRTASAKAVVGRRAAAGTAENVAGSDEEKILAYLEKQPQTPKAISETLEIPRRTVARLLSHLQNTGRVRRDGDSPNDPSASYKLT